MARLHRGTHACRRHLQPVTSQRPSDHPQGTVPPRGSHARDYQPASGERGGPSADRRGRARGPDHRSSGIPCGGVRVRFLCSLLIPALLAASAGVGDAQAPPATQAVESGTRVRVRLVGGGQVLGRLASPLGPYSVQINVCPFPRYACADSTAAGYRILPMSSIAGVEVQVRSSGAFRGAVVGGIAGVVGGLLARHLVTRLSDSDTPPGYGGVLWVAIAGAVGGAFLGPEQGRWQPSPWPAQLSPR